MAICFHRSCITASLLMMLTMSVFSQAVAAESPAPVTLLALVEKHLTVDDKIKLVKIEIEQKQLLQEQIRTEMAQFEIAYEHKKSSLESHNQQLKMHRQQVEQARMLQQEGVQSLQILQQAEMQLHSAEAALKAAQAAIQEFEFKHRFHSIRLKMAELEVAKLKVVYEVLLNVKSQEEQIQRTRNE